MEKLKHLIDCLKPHEVQLAEQYFKLRSNSRASESKKLKLFKLILTGKVSTDEDVASKLYAQKTCSAYSHLKKRLQEDILNVMLMSSSKPEDEDSIAEEIKCRKILIQGKMLINRGVVDDGLQLLQGLSDRAQQFEFHDIKLAADDVLRTYSDLRPHLRATASYDQNINQSFNIMRKILYAKQMNYKVRHSDNSEDVLSYQIPLRPSRDSTSLGSERLHYWYNKFALGDSQQSKNFEKAEHYANALLETIKNNPKLYSKEEVADLFLEIGNLYFSKEQYHQAVKYATGAIGYCKNQEDKRLKAMRIVFLSLLRKGDLLSSREILNTVFDDDAIKKSSHHAPTWILQKAALEFAECHYGESVKTLQKGYANLSHRSDWMIGYRVMELLNILELHDYDWLEYKLEAFRKFVCRLHCNSKGRYKVIYKVFKKHLEAHNDDQNISEYLKSIDHSSEVQAWDPLGAEIINVITWFKGRSVRNTLSI